MSTFQALKSDFVASCSNFVARITPALTNLNARNIFSRPLNNACLGERGFRNPKMRISAQDNMRDQNTCSMYISLPPSAFALHVLKFDLTLN